MAQMTITQFMTGIKNWVLGKIGNITALIPSQASSSNQLADKAFVNSSIATATATFRGTYNVVSDLSLSYNATHAQIQTALATKMSALSITPDNNDYAFVQIPTADATPTQIAKIERYKYSGSAWAFEYELNNSGFTAAQWAAINSGATLELIGKLSALPTNSELTTILNGKASKAENATAGHFASLDANGNPTDSGISLEDNGAYDVTAHNSGAKFADLSALLSNVNLNTLIPVAVRKGGMSIKFVQSSDNKYVQARLMAQNFTTDVTQWQGVDDEPTEKSKNLVESKGVLNCVMKNSSAFDLSAHFATNGSPAIFADLDAATAALKSLDSAYRKGGMSIKFILPDNSYVQYRYLRVSTTGTPDPITNPLFWQKQGAEVSVKNSTSSTYKNARALQIGTSNYNVEDEVATKLDLNVYGKIRFNYGETIGLGVGVGNEVDLTPAPTTNYRCALVPCKAGDIFLIAGIGGYNPRLWGFIDSSNILLEVAAAGLNSQGVTKTAPTNAAYLIINDNNSNRNCYRKNTLESDVSALEERTDDIETSLVAINEEIEEHTEIIELSDSPFVLKHLYQGNLISNNNKNASFENKVLALKGSTISVDSGYKYQYATYNITTKQLIEQVAWKTTPTEIASDCDIRIEISDLNESVLSDTSISEHLHYKLYAKKQSVIELSVEDYNEIYEAGLDIAEQADNLINVIGYSQFVGKVMKVAKPYKYSSWPMCLAVNNELVCAYTIGNSHYDNMYSAIYAKVSSNGVVWSAKKKIIDTFRERDGITGKGNDTQGNALLLNRVGPFDVPWMYFEVWKSNNGLDWECISKPTFATQVGHCGDIINVPDLGLVSFFNTYGSSRSWGYIVSEDDGVTWSQHVVESGLSAIECPAEISAVYLGDGKILAMGRLESNDSTHQNMWQMQSSDNGVTWSREQTNIYSVQNTPSVLFDSVSNNVTMYIMLRSSGNLVKYVKDADVVWNNPTSWGDATVISSGWATGSDVGNVNAVRSNGNDFVSFYSGTPTQTGIYVMIQ